MRPRVNLRCVADRYHGPGERTLRQFACWCLRQVWPLLTDERSRQAVVIVERFAARVTTEDLATAGFVAEAAAAWAVAWIVAEIATEIAAKDAGAKDDARAKAWIAAWDSQAAWLRDHAKPSWSLAN